MLDTTKAATPEAETPEYLELLARVKKALETATEIRVDNSNIRRFEGQPREDFDPGGIRNLSESIDRGGQTMAGLIRHKPAKIRYEIIDIGDEILPRRIDGRTDYELIDGERRWRGVGIIPQARRPLYRASLIEADDDVVQYLISGITNFNRQGHTAVETMRAIDQYLKFKFPMEVIAKLLGISAVWAHQIHGLKNLEEPVLALLNPRLPKDQQLPITAAVQISKADKKIQVDLASRVMTRDVSLSRLRGEVVRISQEKQLPIRVHEPKADQVWKSFINKMQDADRTLDDAEAIISSGNVDRFIKRDNGQRKLVLQRIEDMEGTLARLKRELNRRK